MCGLHFGNHAVQKCEVEMRISSASFAEETRGRNDSALTRGERMIDNEFCCFVLRDGRLL